MGPPFGNALAHTACSMPTIGHRLARRINSLITKHFVGYVGWDGNRDRRSPWHARTRHGVLADRRFAFVLDRRIANTMAISEVSCTCSSVVVLNARLDRHASAATVIQWLRILHSNPHNGINGLQGVLHFRCVAWRLANMKHRT